MTNDKALKLARETLEPIIDDCFLKRGDWGEYVIAFAAAIEAECSKELEENPSQRLFSAEYNISRAEDEIYDELDKLFPDQVDDISWDYYDNSLEIYFVASFVDYMELNAELFTLIKSWGFDRYWANFKDGTEIYCSGNRHPAVHTRTGQNRSELFKIKKELQSLKTDNENLMRISSEQATELAAAQAVIKDFLAISPRNTWKSGLDRSGQEYTENVFKTVREFTELCEKAQEQPTQALDEAIAQAVEPYKTSKVYWLIEQDITSCASRFLALTGYVANEYECSASVEWSDSTQWAMRFASKEQAILFIGLLRTINSNLLYKDTITGFLSSDRNLHVRDHMYMLNPTPIIDEAIHAKKEE